MEILKLKNNHLQKQEDIEYGCECERCGTVFMFHRSEASIPRCINLKLEYCTIKCPNCDNVISLIKCYNFNYEGNKESFMKLHKLKYED